MMLSQAPVASPFLHVPLSLFTLGNVVMPMNRMQYSPLGRAGLFPCSHPERLLLSTSFERGLKVQRYAGVSID
jgi:hypothetical protein